MRDRLPAAGAALDPTKDVRGNVEEGVADARALLKRFDEVSAKLGEPLGRRRDGEAPRGAGAAAGPDRRASTAGSSTARSRSRWTRCACRRATPTSRRSPAASGAAWRCAGCCSSSRTCCCSTSPPTTSTPSRWPGSSATSRSITGTVVAVTHDRYFLDNVAGWILELDRGAGIPWEGNYSSWLEQKQAAAGRRRRRPSRRASARSSASWSGCACRRARARPRARRACTPTRRCSPRPCAERDEQAGDRRSRPARAWATSSSRPRTSARATATGC